MKRSDGPSREKGSKKMADAFYNDMNIKPKGHCGECKFYASPPPQCVHPDGACSNGNEKWEEKDDD